MTEPLQSQTLELSFEADVRGLTPSLKVATVSRGGGEHKSFVSDEPVGFGGLNSAPTPLMYFTAAIAL